MSAAERLTERAQAIVRKAWVKTGLTKHDYARSLGFNKNYVVYFLNHNLPQYRAIMRLAEHIPELAPLAKKAMRMERRRFKVHAKSHLKSKPSSRGVFYPNPNAPELWKPPYVLPPPVGF